MATHSKNTSTIDPFDLHDAIISVVGCILVFILLTFVGLDAMLIICMWGFFACLGIGLIGMTILEPMREEKRERERLALKQK